MIIISREMADVVAASAGEVAASLAAVPAAEARGFVRAVVDFCVANVDVEAVAWPVADWADRDRQEELVRRILAVTGGWGADRWFATAAWQLALSAFQLALPTVAPRAPRRAAG